MRPALRSVFSLLRPRFAGSAMRADEYAAAFRTVRKRRTEGRYSASSGELRRAKGEKVVEDRRERNEYVCNKCQRAATVSGTKPEVRKTNIPRKKDFTPRGVIIGRDSGEDTQQTDHPLKTYIESILDGTWQAPEEDRGEVPSSSPDTAQKYSELYRALLDRRKAQGNEGVVDAWTSWKIHERLEPPEVPGAGDIWRVLLDVGKEDQRFMYSLWNHINTYIEGYGPFGWNGVYEDVVGHFVTTDIKRAVLWHTRMKSYIAPRNWSTFFMKAFRSMEEIMDQKLLDDTWNAIQSIHASTILPCAHTPVFHDLLRRDRFEDALRWHRFCIKRGDAPKSSEDVNGIIVYLCRTKLTNDLVEFFKRMNKASVPFAASSAVTLIRDRRYHRVDVLKVLVGIGEEARSAIQSADFLTVLLRGEEPILEHIIIFLKSWGSCLIPREALHSLYFRCGNPEQFYDAVNQFRNHGFTVRDEDLVSVDQEQIIEKYSELEAEILDALERNDAELALKAVQAVANRIHTTHPKLHEFTIEMLSKVVVTATDTPYNQHIIDRFGSLGRPPTKCPQDNLSTLILLLLTLSRGFHPVPPSAWHFVFRKLGKDGRLYDLAQLVLHLVAIYRAEPRTVAAIFPHKFFHALVEWPFLAPVPKGPLVAPFLPAPLPQIPPVPQYAQNLPREKKALSHLDFTWGIRIARRMLGSGVHVDPRVLRRAMRLRLRDIVNGKVDKMGVAIDIGPREVFERCTEEWGGLFVPDVVTDEGEETAKLGGIIKRKRVRTASWATRDFDEKPYFP